MGYDLQRVGFGLADESSAQLWANTARLWSLGKGPRRVNTAKERANTFGFLALQSNSYCHALANSSADPFLEVLPRLRAANAAYDAVVVVWDNLPAHKTAAVEALARQHQLYSYVEQPAHSMHRSSCAYPLVG